MPPPEPTQRPKRGSAAFEVGQAALGVGLDAFLEILGATQPVLLDELALGRRLDETIGLARMRRQKMLSSRPV